MLWRAVVVAATLAAVAGSVRAQSPVEGLWLTEHSEGLVSIGPCGPRLCGWLIDRDKLRAGGADAARAVALGVRRPELETTLLTGFTGGPIRWDRGRITDPRSGAVYDSHLRLLDPRRLKVQGCILRVLCGGQVWTRAPGP